MSVNKELKNLKIFFGTFVVFMTMLLGFSLFWNIRNEHQIKKKYAIIEAEASFNKDLVFRRWAAMHGGVYVPITENTQPNVYLKSIPERDITSKENKNYTLLNPAYIIRQVYEIAGEQYEIKGHITDLNPIRPENKPDAWEAMVLNKLEKEGESEYSSIETIEGEEYMRFMHVLKIEDGCLRCHAEQGDKLGDTRGGISVSVPMVKYNKVAFLQIKTLTIAHIVIYLVVLPFSFISYKRFYEGAEKRNRMQQKVQESEANLQMQNAEYQILNRRLIQKNEELSVAKQKAEESDRLKTAFLSNLSHEINTPMNSIFGFTQLLLEPDLSSEEKEKYVARVHQSGERMLKTVSDIVEFAKIEAGIVTLKMVSFNVVEQIKELSRIFLSRAEEKGINLSFQEQPSVPESSLLIITDKYKFNFILSSLIQNAIKYTEKGAIEVGYHIHSEYIQFYVKDTGIGIPEERQKAIFNHFEQADIRDLQALQGIGLGLTITKTYVEMLGGNIWLESVVNKGSVFYFTLPYKVEVINYQTSIKNDLNSDKKKKMDRENLKLKILIAEDDRNSALIIENILKSYCKTFITVDSGLKAVDECRKNPDLDLILMDIKMPELNGYEATQQIRQFNKEVIIIAQTAYALSGDKEAALEAGCNGYISKPINRNELLLLVQEFFIE